MLDDIVIFFVAMKTLQIKGISNKYTKYSHLIGGVIMIIIGLLMLFKPEWLMFNFEKKSDFLVRFFIIYFIS